MVATRNEGYVGYGLNIPMVPNWFTNAETSWRRKSVWKYEVMFEGGLRMKRTDKTDWRKRGQLKPLPRPLCLGAVMAAVLKPLLLFGSGRQRSTAVSMLPLPKPLLQGAGKGAVDGNGAWRSRFSEWSNQHGLGSGWPTATWIVVNHKHALNQELFMEEEIDCFWSSNRKRISPWKKTCIK